MVQAWIMDGGAVSGSGSCGLHGSIASIQLRIIGRFTGSRAARGALSPAATMRAAASRICSSFTVPSFTGEPGAGRGRPWR